MKKFILISNFLFSSSVFYPFEKLSSIVIRFDIVICKLFQFGKSLKYVLWERVKSLDNNKDVDLSKYMYQRQDFTKGGTVSKAGLYQMWVCIKGRTLSNVGLYQRKDFIKGGYVSNMGLIKIWTLPLRISIEQIKLPIFLHFCKKASYSFNDPS